MQIPRRKAKGALLTRDENKNEDGGLKPAATKARGKFIASGRRFARLLSSWLKPRPTKLFVVEPGIPKSQDGSGLEAGEGESGEEEALGAEFAIGGIVPLVQACVHRAGPPPPKATAGIPNERGTFASVELRSRLERLPRKRSASRMACTSGESSETEPAGRVPMERKVTCNGVFTAAGSERFVARA